ncbi:hypothetical protein FRC20_003315 [Serendipita sp. 405]|nr:hypothetical protein FRC20_003315 [Serendipita sp. 405]
MSRGRRDAEDLGREQQHRTTIGQARVDQVALNLSHSQAGTSHYANSMAETSHQDEDARSKISTYSYHTDADATKLLQDIDGRTINTLSDQYYLPSDDPEWTRLEKQHIAVVIGLGGLYPAKEEVQAVLKPQEGETKRILDLGCGTGTWAIEMAREYPHAEVIGVDLAPVPMDREAIPANYRFEIDNINLGLAHFHGQFDVIHIRLVGSGLKNFKDRMRDIHRCLKPGGIVLWIDADFDFYSTEKFEYHLPATDDNPGGSWTQRIGSEMRRACLKIGSDLHAMESALDAGLWQDPLIDSETCKIGSLYLPMGTWASHEDPGVAQLLKYVGALMRQDIIEGIKSMVPLLVKVGRSKNEVETWRKKLTEELTELKIHTVARFRLAWGRRIPVPKASSAQQGSVIRERSDSPSKVNYPWLYVYDTEEAALEQVEARNKQKASILPSMTS